MEVALLFGVLVTAALLAGLSIGFRIAIARYNRRHVSQATQLAQLTAKAETDPARFGIDLGKEYAANTMQRTLDRIRDEID